MSTMSLMQNKFYDIITIIKIYVQHLYDYNTNFKIA